MSRLRVHAFSISVDSYGAGQQRRAPRSGESLFAGVDAVALGYKCTSHAASPAATHVVLTNTR